MWTNIYASNLSTDISRNTAILFSEKFPQEKKRYPQILNSNFRKASVDNVDNYFPRRFSPIFSTSPAPMVINKSPFMQFSKRKFSISSKVGK